MINSSWCMGSALLSRFLVGIRASSTHERSTAGSPYRLTYALLPVLALTVYYRYDIDDHVRKHRCQHRNLSGAQKYAWAPGHRLDQSVDVSPAIASLESILEQLSHESIGLRYFRIHWRMGSLLPICRSSRRLAPMACYADVSHWPFPWALPYPHGSRCVGRAHTAVVLLEIGP